MVGDQKINSVLISEEQGQLGYELKKLILHVQVSNALKTPIYIFENY